MAQATGRAFIKADAALFRSREGASLQIGGKERESKMTDPGDHDWVERLIPARVEMTLQHIAETDLRAINNMVSVTITFETDTGVTWSIANAVNLSVGPLANGEVDVVFEGRIANRVL